MNSTKKRRKYPKGIRPWKGGWQAYIRIDGVLRSKDFSFKTTFAVMRAWREEQKGKLATIAPEAGSFAADIAEYLSRVTAKPTYKQKAAHLALWAHALGRDRVRNSITTTEIDRVLMQWLTAGLDPQTVRKRRTSLLSLFVLVDGKGAANPVRGSYLPPNPKPEDRGTDYETIARILATMPTHVDVKKGTPAKLSLAPIRCAVLAYTGLPPGMLGAVEATDLNLLRETVRVNVRLKGGGVEARTLELTPHGVVAFQRFNEVGAYGPFNVEKLNVSFQRACRRVGVSGLTLYDLRHSFGAQLYLETKDLATVARFMLHADGSPTTLRYTKAAHRAVDAAAAQGFLSVPGAGARPQRKASPSWGQKLSPKVVPRRQTV